MKILFGVQATGNGHISRCREVVSALKQAGHDVYVILSGRDPDHLWDVDIFKPYSVYRGLTFAVSRGKLKYFKTITQLNLLQFYRDIAEFSAEYFDLAIVDFEPLTARIAKRKGITSIGLGHQYAFKYPIPLSKRDPVALGVLKYFAPADYSIGLHWYHFNQPILPPIIPRLPVEKCSAVARKILVYLPFESRDDVMDFLTPCKEYSFYYYTGVDTASTQGHITLRPFSRNGFIEDLKTCSGVISNGGFELASEALHLGKKLLVRPLAGQLEQESNALCLKNLKLGTVMNTLDKTVLRRWLAAPMPEPIHYPDVAQAIADWVGSGDWSNTKALVDEVWSRVNQNQFRAVS